MPRQYNIKYDRDKEPDWLEKGIAHTDSIEYRIAHAIFKGDYELADKIMDENKVGRTTRGVCGGSSGEWKNEDTLFGSIVGANQRSFTEGLSFAIYQYLLQRDPEFLFSTPIGDQAFSGSALHRCFEGRFVEDIFDDLIIRARDPGNQERGLHVNGKNKLGDTPIFYVSTTYALEVLDNEGADKTIRNNNGQTALIFNASKGEFLIQRKFLRLGYDGNAADNSGKAALHYIMTQEYPIELIGKIQLHLKYGADPFMEDKDGVRPFCEANLDKIRTYYREHYADMERRWQSAKKTHDMIKKGYPNIEVKPEEVERLERTVLACVGKDTVPIMLLERELGGGDMPRELVVSTLADVIKHRVWRDDLVRQAAAFEAIAPQLAEIDKSRDREKLETVYFLLH